MQSVVWALVLSTTGLGMGHGLSPLLAFLLALAAWGLCLPLAMALRARDMRGPAEALLQRLTVGRGSATGRVGATPVGA
ncbi:DUF418 domain-containing protein [Brachybacterium timonense]|uniref:DUF418 domain-containing protein n=1 Tax=Brachybacterium timonense TaxID=2050896 RepID=UPI001FE9A43E|nr:DUF418 domain-containing protein [Brachybacterium timonense]